MAVGGGFRRNNRGMVNQKWERERLSECQTAIIDGIHASIIAGVPIKLTSRKLPAYA
jgi:hypothetical protein